MDKFNREKLLSASKTKLQIADELRMSKSNFYRRVKDANLNLPNRLLNRKWQKEIYDTLGYPYGLSKKDFLDV